MYICYIYIYTSLILYKLFWFRIPKHSESFFTNHDDKINDIDDNIVTVEVVNDNKLSYDSYTQVT